MERKGSMTKVDVAKTWSLNYRLLTSVITSVAAEVSALGVDPKELFLLAAVDDHPHPAELYAGPRLGREPGLRDCFLLLRQLGVAPDVAMFRYPERHRFESLDQAVEECRQALGRLWDEDEGRGWLEQHLRRDEDGTLVQPDVEVTAGVLHWKP